MGTDNEHHRPGLLKQENKAHKHGRHRSKGALNAATKGRTSVKLFTKKCKSALSRSERRNQMVQNRLKKRQEVFEKKRLLGKSKALPFLVSVVPLALDIEVEKMMDDLKQCTSGSEISVTTEGVFHMRVPRLKQHFSFILPERGNIYAILDSLKVADTVLFVMSALSNPWIDKVAQEILKTILAQGLPSTAVALVDLEKVPLKKRNICKQDIQKLISQWLPEEKVTPVDVKGGNFNLLRKVGGQKQRKILQRDRRPHLLAESVEYCAHENSSLGTLKVSGFLRGQMLDVNKLVHIPGWGDFQMKQIVVEPQCQSDFDKEGMAEKILMTADPSIQTSLISENAPDPLDAEQTWPTEEEIISAKQKQKQQKLIKKVPKGTSDYQACWIPDEDIEEMEDESEDEEFDMEAQSDEESDCEPKAEGDFDKLTVTESDVVDFDNYDENMDMDEEEIAKEKLKNASTDRQFPDEVDTPQDVPAKDRFQKYRGLASFRTSFWDSKENLPAEYAKIYQFGNFNRTRKRVFSEIENETVKGAAPGSYVTIDIANVPAEKFSSRHPNQPIVVHGMLEHEQKMSVINVVLRRSQNSIWAEVPIKSKEELVFQCGYRRYKAHPIYSQHTNGGKHKYERYFQPDSTVVATLYAPIIYPPAAVLAFKEKPDKTQDLVATGKVLSVNPDRLVIKRVVLSGHPFKVHKRSAVVRFMFFNREDIDWFKPVELRTKYGRRGHIREPLGTHGHMKTIFDGQLKSQDTVLMYLYKRVFPRWSYDPITSYPVSLYKTLPTITEDEEMV